MHALVVEPHLPDRERLEEALKRCGAMSHGVADCRRAETLTKTEKPRLLLLSSLLLAEDATQYCNALRVSGIPLLIACYARSGTTFPAGVSADLFFQLPGSSEGLDRALRGLLLQAGSASGGNRPEDLRITQLEEAITELAAEIVERRDAEEALKERETLYRALFDNVPVGLGLADMQGNLIAYNDFMLIPGGWTREDIDRIGNVAALYYDPAERTAALELARKQGFLDRFEVRFRRKDGGFYPALMSLKQIVIQGRPCWQSMCEDITDRKRAEEHVHALSQRILHVQEAERRRVARELHDGVNQLLSAARYRMERMGKKSARVAPEVGAPEVLDLLDQAIQEVRRISQNLRPAVLDDLGLVAAMRSTCEELRRRTGIEVAFQCSRLPKRLTPDAEMALFRITQEALSNTERHARARNVRVEIRRHGPACELRIHDDGCGFDPSSNSLGRKDGKPGLGLVHMAERARLAGGSLSIKSAAGSGTEILARLPVAAAKTRRAAAS